MAFLELSGSPNLVSRKIWVIEKSWNFYTCTLKTFKTVVYWYAWFVLCICIWQKLISRKIWMAEKFIKIHTDVCITQYGYYKTLLSQCSGKNFVKATFLVKELISRNFSGESNFPIFPLCVTFNLFVFVSDGGLIPQPILQPFPQRNSTQMDQWAMQVTRPRAKSITAPSVVGLPMRSDSKRVRVSFTSYLRVSDF